LTTSFAPHKCGTTEIAKAVAALLLVDHGKYDKKKHTAAWFAGKKCVPESWAAVLSFSAAAAAWKGMEDSTLAKKTFIDICKTFGGFACTFYEAKLSGAKEPVVLSIDNAAVILYAPWVNSQRRPADMASRRLSRSALALSPRGALDDDSQVGSVSRGTAKRFVEGTGMKKGEFFALGFVV
jgi:hypothetical protein